MKTPNFKLNAVLLCALAITIVSILPIVNIINIICGGMLLGGFLSVNYFKVLRQRQAKPPNHRLYPTPPDRRIRPHESRR